MDIRVIIKLLIINNKQTIAKLMMDVNSKN
mgnify:FL=1